MLFIREGWATIPPFLFSSPLLLLTIAACRKEPHKKPLIFSRGPFPKLPDREQLRIIK
jgi:hypothetical protein